MTSKEINLKIVIIWIIIKKYFIIYLISVICFEKCEKRDKT